MSNNLSICDLTRQWCMKNPAHRPVSLKENKLLQVLYSAYCLRSGQQNQWGQFTTEADYSKACRKLHAWYNATYQDQFQMPGGKPGEKRTVDSDEAKYTFHYRYSDKRTFTQYLIGGRQKNGSQLLYSFVLHTAVAFLVPPDQLDDVLKSLGFHPLHVKNIHHLAIFYVMLDPENRKADPNFNPFDRVRELYFQAQKILEEPGQTPSEAYLYGDKFSHMIREDLFVRQNIGRENFEKLVRLNKDSLNKRHSLILKEFYKLIAVFFYVFDDHQFSAEKPMEDDTTEVDYSFYAFLGRYCHAYLDRKHYRRWLSGMIKQQDKHPTRNMMILLWLYAHCFAYIPNIFVEPKTVNRIQRDLYELDSELEKYVNQFYAQDRLDVYGMIMGSKKRRVKQVFDGEEILAEINQKLMDYDWGVLNEKLPFDHYIMQLKNLVMHLDPSDESSCVSIRYRDAELTGIPTGTDNVPYPLVAINWMMHHLKDAHTLDSSYNICPLDCNLYEQI